MTVTLSNEAWLDLDRIGTTVADHNGRHAIILIDDLLRACHSLENMPLRYPLIARREDRPIRRRPHGNYLIFYLVKNDTVSIIRILHGAMDYDAILFPTD
ncbi:type II toxin-antitoxin system RelE/ParE family toxin [Beijerinckia sp. L45]|uniref:type II toxin-antitoxin system RelE/ParE family toxin n=1 Tax=Beijerinckia sp. L45 TaxID=1641855 RepID=UPI00131B4669|nr:type II toxin-antitoxin system RelE/ParE family toxin [Beijerinckia sp. L45]